MTREELGQSLNLKVELVPIHRSNRPGTEITPSKITIHNTDNGASGADANAHSRFIRNTARLSWHYTVDDKRVIKHIPIDEKAFHAKSEGNSQSIGIEICMHRGINQEGANERAARLTAALCHDLRLDSEDVVTHKHWTGKNCPSLLLARFDSFRDRVQAILDDIDDDDEGLLADIDDGDEIDGSSGGGSSDIASGRQVRVTASALNVRNRPSITGRILGTVSRGDLLDVLGDTSDERWLQIRKNALQGFSSRSFLENVTPIDLDHPFDAIVAEAASSSVMDIRWRDRGRAPAGYVKGMALGYARAHARLRLDDPAAAEMSKPDTGSESRDALALYSEIFDSMGMDNDAAGADTLRHLFVLMMGLGMRESSGRHCEGRDRSASNTTSQTAEAGLFQASHNLSSAHRLLPELMNAYDEHPEGFLSIFSEGVRCRPRDLANFGSGRGRDYQELAKNCPTFAAEFAAIGLRNRCRHWGPIRRREAEVRPEVNHLFRAVQKLVDDTQAWNDPQILPPDLVGVLA